MDSVNDKVHEGRLQTIEPNCTVLTGYITAAACWDSCKRRTTANYGERL